MTRETAHGVEARTPAPTPKTLGALRESGWSSRSVHEELRENLIKRLRAGTEVFPGIVGYGDSVVPQIQNAVLSGHSFILLGLRGQAKTRIARSLTGLLDEWLPAIDGSELNEDPFAPVTVPSLRLAAEAGDDLPIRWMHRSERYQEKLATPDVTVADLIGDVDPIKAATRKLTFADPEVIHFGILPRANRGLFCVNELPDLQARIQVGLLNILEEGDIQVRGFPIRMPLDLGMIFTANPEDYTNRGSIITPLRDRIASQILTHYPRELEQAMEITEQEAWRDRGDHALPVAIPQPIREAIDLVAFEARDSEFVDQSSGVSARLSIALFENVVSNAERRALIAGETSATVRPADLFAGVSAITGKVELVYDGEREGITTVAKALVGKALSSAFERAFPDGYAEDEGDAGGSAPVYESLLKWFRSGGQLELDDVTGDEAHYGKLAVVDGLEGLVLKHIAGAASMSAGERASLMELVLEGLHQNSLLSRDDSDNSTRVFGDMLAQMARSLGG
ncbi:MAG: magnesium chelatase subunit I [Planctomycetota bacterium]|jgi:magnesium chelatase subunit I